MTVKMFNESYEYAKKKADRLKEKYGIQVKCQPYSMYDGSKGIQFIILDCCGEYYTDYKSGIWDTVNEMKMAIDVMYSRSIRVCQ